MTPSISFIASLISACRSGLATSNRRRRITSIEPASRLFRCSGGRSSRRPIFSVSTPSWPARRTSVANEIIREGGAGIAGRASDHIAIAATDNDVGQRGRKPWPFGHRKQMALALCVGDLDQHLIVDDRRATQQRSRDRDIVLAGESPHQVPRRVGQRRQPLGKIDPRRKLGMRHQAGQHPVKQVDMVGAKARGALQEQFAEPPRGLGAAFGVAAANDIVEFRDQHGGCRHEPIQTGHFCRFSAIYGPVRKRRVRSNLHIGSRKIALRAAWRPCRLPAKELYPPQLMVSHTIA